MGRALGGEREKIRKEGGEERRNNNNGDREGQGIDKGRSEKKNEDGEGHL